MSEVLRFLPAGSDALLVELDDLKATLELFDDLRSARLAGITELVPAARTVLIRFDPLVVGFTELSRRIAQVGASERRSAQGTDFEIPVVYDGEDLGDVAKLLGWTIDELIHRHTSAAFTVAFTGFAPGFSYMTCNDPEFDVPRRQSPRVRIPAGSVAIAGKFGGIYPSDSPGGWQLLGTTSMRMWDTARERPALLAPGDRVRFRRTDRRTARAQPFGLTAAPPRKQAVGLLVTRADRAALFQDSGRPGRADQGVSRSGALDRNAFVEANFCVGNDRGEPVVEIVFGGFSVRADRDVTLAVTGAPCPLTIRAPDGTLAHAPFGRPFALDAGDELELGAPPRGMRSYLALRGGFAVEPTIGSSSTDTLAKIGPEPIIVGHLLVPAEHPSVAVQPERPSLPPLPSGDETVSLDVILGPRSDWFTESGLATLASQSWQVTAESSRVGMRLRGSVPLERRDGAELPSEGTTRGSIQVPHSGQPVLFLSDHPLTGGYPVIGVIAAHHLDLAGQVPIGANIRFNVIAPFAPLTKETSR